MAPELQDFKTIAIANCAQSRQSGPAGTSHNAFSDGCRPLIFRLQPFRHPVIGIAQQPVELSITR
jgi:hypothetical protein